MMPAAQYRSGKAVEHRSTLLLPLSASVPDCSAMAETMVPSARQMARVYQSRMISSSTLAAESMSKDTTDLNAGAAAAAAAQTMQQQP